MQYRLSTLLLVFVVVWASLAVFGAAGGIAVAAIVLAVAAYTHFDMPDPYGEAL